jgi:L-arabinonolactonase
MQPVDILASSNILGEGILWDARRQRLCWTDIQGQELYRYDWAGGEMEVLATPERVGSFGLIAGDDRLITAFASGIALYDAATATVEWLARPKEIVTGIRFNDGRIDRRGRFWSGTMVENDECAEKGSLYSMDCRGGLRRHVRDVRIANSICTSPDGTRLYFADSPTRTIFVYELNEPDGDLGPPRVFATTPAGTVPDGATVDVDGCLWSAHWGGGCLVRYTPEGRIDRTIAIPASQPTCACFAGPNLDVLCVTSAREGLSESTLQTEPHAGAVFLYRAGVQGLAEPEYRL